MKRFLALSLGALAAAAVASPGIAQAAVSDCKTSQVCIFADNNYGRWMGYRSAGGGLANISATNNDRMDSWINNTGTNAAWYHDADGKGTCRTMGAKASDPNINFTDSDKASSWRTDRGC